MQGIKNGLIFAVSKTNNADVAKLVDALDLGSSAARRGGSIPFIRTKDRQKTVERKHIGLFLFYLKKVFNTFNKLQR